MTTALFPGRFDPVTNGHVDICTRAANLFDQIVVGVFDLKKGTLFSTEERVDLFTKAMSDHDNVTVNLSNSTGRVSRRLTRQSTAALAATGKKTPGGTDARDLVAGCHQ